MWRSAPRVLTVPNELTNECLWGGGAPPNGSRLSCWRLARRRKGVGRQSVPARAQHSASTRAISARQLQALVRRHPSERQPHALSVCTRLVIRHRSSTRTTAIPSRILDIVSGMVTMRIPCESAPKRNTLERKGSVLLNESIATLAALALSHVGTAQLPVGRGRRPARIQKAPATRSRRTRLKRGTLLMGQCRLTDRA